MNQRNKNSFEMPFTVYFVGMLISRYRDELLRSEKKSQHLT